MAMNKSSKDHDKLQSEQAHACPECGSKNLIFDHDIHETVCTTCGHTKRDDESFDRTRLEGRIFSPEDHKNKRVEPTDISIHDKGLYTEIGSVDRDAHGRKLPLATRVQMWRLRKWQKKARFSTGWTLAQAMIGLKSLKDRLNAPKIVHKEAAVIYRKAYKKGLIRGHSIAEIGAAAFYAAYRRAEIPKPLREIAKISSLKKNDVARCYRLLINELGYKPSPLDVVDDINRIAGELKTSEKTVTDAIRLLKEAKLKGYTPGDPSGDASGVLYIACSQNGESRTQEEIAEAAGVTGNTVRNRYQAINRAMGFKKITYRTRYGRRHGARNQKINREQVMELLMEFCDKLGIDQKDEIRREAENLFQGLQNKQLYRGNFIDEIVAAVLFSTCRKCGIPKTIDEVADAVSIDRKYIFQGCKLLQEELGYRPSTDPAPHINRIAERLSISDNTKEHAIETYKKAKLGGYRDGGQPVSDAAAAIYIACLKTGEKKTQVAIARVAGITDITVRNRYVPMKRAVMMQSN